MSWWTLPPTSPPKDVQLCPLNWSCFNCYRSSHPPLLLSYWLTREGRDGSLLVLRGGVARKGRWVGLASLLEPPPAQSPSCLIKVSQSPSPPFSASCSPTLQCLDLDFHRAQVHHLHHAHWEGWQWWAEMNFKIGNHNFFLIYTWTFILLLKHYLKKRSDRLWNRRRGFSVFFLWFCWVLFIVLRKFVLFCCCFIFSFVWFKKIPSLSLH